MKPRHLVVAGHGMAGHRLVRELRGRDGAGRWRVTVLAAERRPAYDRVSLSSYFTGGSAESLQLPGADFAGDPLVDLRLGEEVTAVHRAGRTVTTSAGRELGYDVLVLATGARPFVPPVPGHGLPGCFTYRTIDDLEAIEAAAAGETAGVVIGGGLLGLEAANALRSLGLATEVVEIAPHLMPAQVDEGGGALLAGLLARLGVSARCGAGVEAITAGPDGRVAAVTLSGGTRLPAGLVVFSAGIRPCDELGRAAGLPAGDRGGIITDRACRTADPHIYAIGDCAAPGGRGYGLVAPAYAMADAVADQLLGGQASLPDPDTATKLKLLGVDVASFGDAHGRTAGALSVVVSNPAAGTYGKLVVSDDARTLLGGVLVGDASQFAVLRPLVGRPLPGDPVGLIAGPGAAAGGAAAGLAGLPGDAVICSCHTVPKDVIVGAVAAGAADVAAVKACTRAGTGCGSCLPALRQLLELGGAAAPKVLCEHFSYSRAELFEIAAATKITTFSELIAARGQGRGCDICKPAVASILATLASAAGRRGHILDGEQASLQDTNDHFLANLQRNGTYSVVPRIPAGEITPEKLITIGEVARDFGLYTKITGAQRIDLLGARVEQLPAIWGRLVEAGFESGHAYGKAVRTVKSCVGSTWCRYGVQDSVTLAIELELRYRGLRAPHKIKAAVSGCARECAEARGKDFGVIATEKGWNLYVGGNGGFQPRHADLLLADASRDLLVTVIDRFLAFYVRTAERLQRTSAWIEAMEGGLGHLRSVIVDDSLGICAELEAAMAAHVRSYTDEWRGVLEDPGKLARFVSFVNAPGAPDPAVRFTVERGQPVPAPQPRAGRVLLGMPGQAAPVPVDGHRTRQPDLEGAGTR